MLILSRRNGESFVIGENIKITVLSQRSNQVRIGIDAPREMPVFREEVLERRKAQGQQSTPGSSKKEPLKKTPSNAEQSAGAETEAATLD